MPLAWVNGMLKVSLDGFELPSGFGRDTMQLVTMCESGGRAKDGVL